MSVRQGGESEQGGASVGAAGRSGGDATRAPAQVEETNGGVAHLLSSSPLRLSSMAGTSCGMWGRSSSAPAAAASLQVVSRARPRTSGTWEGRPAGRWRAWREGVERDGWMEGGQERAAQHGAEVHAMPVQGRPCKEASSATTETPPPMPTLVQQQGEGDGDGLAALRRRRELGVRQPQREAPHAPAARGRRNGSNMVACMRASCPCGKPQTI